MAAMEEKTLNVADLKQRIAGFSGVDFFSVRYQQDRHQLLEVEQDVPGPIKQSNDDGVMITVHHGGGTGYAATSDVSQSGLTKAFGKAKDWAEFSGKRSVTDYSQVPMAHPQGEFRSPVKKPFPVTEMPGLMSQMCDVSRAMKIHDQIVYWSAMLWHARSERWYLTSGGGEVYQDFDRLVPMLTVTANEGAESQTRTFGHMAWVRQQGLEMLDLSGYFEKGKLLAEEARELLAAPNCPEGTMDVLLDPDQMILQIHESIGHPLELDRILGDERNYAGTSFVTEDMFGSYQYGSDLLNVTYDPTRDEQAASFAFDDDGTEAKREFIIEKGVLKRPLGGTVSQARAGMQGVATTRASDWFRPAIDRMSNLNLEPGSSSFDDLVGQIENGVYMKTNQSWSIDDSRNKFQFGCEWGRRIENGKLTSVVKNPNYRGISESFWRSLKGVGNESTFEVLGTPYCGKGEPNQAVFVGHASPVCRFENVAVFGGE